MKNQISIGQIEDTQLEPTQQMDEILVKNKKFEVVNILLELLCKEMGISPESQPKAVLMEIGKVFEEYYKAMEDFRKLGVKVPQYKAK